MLIVFEGLDRSGKTTQSTRLANRLNCTRIAFPIRSTEVGQLIDKHLKSPFLSKQAAHLLFSANRWDAMNSIEAQLQSSPVVLDRYAYSGLVYSIANNLEKEWSINSDKGLLKPHIVFFLDIDPNIASNRPGYGQEVYENTPFQTKVRDGFMQLIDKNWVVIDATRDVNVIEEEIYQRILLEMEKNSCPAKYDLFL